MKWALSMLVLVGCGPRHRSEDTVETTPCESAVTAPGSGPARFDAFLSEYRAAAPDVRSELATRFAASGGVPIVADDGTVVFVYVGNRAEHDVRVVGDFRAKSFFRVDWDPAGEPLVRAVEGGSVWFARMRFQLDARFDYQLVVDGTAAPDPLNPRAIESGIAGHASELRMPKAELPVVRSDVPHGSITVVDEPWAKPKVTIYVPPGYDRRQRYSVVYTADGTAFVDLIRLPAILDDLIARDEIAPVIAVMIDAAEDRSSWYGWNPLYLAYLDKVVAYVDGHYATQADPSHRLHVGTSAGGRASLQVGLVRSTQFANIAMLSPSLAAAPHIYEPYFSGKRAPPVGLRVWLSAGRYENAICEDTHMMARWFRDAGVPTKVVYTREGHSFGTWRHVVPEMLAYFLPR